MLAQSFKPADELDITEPQRDALCKTLVLLETRQLRRVAPGEAHLNTPRSFCGQFNMNQWRGENECGTIACIGGTAELIGNIERGELEAQIQHNANLRELFYPHAISLFKWKDITVEQAATALRSYLTTGNANWHEAVSGG